MKKNHRKKCASITLNENEQSMVNKLKSLKGHGSTSNILRQGLYELYEKSFTSTAK